VSSNALLPNRAPRKPPIWPESITTPKSVAMFRVAQYSLLAVLLNALAVQEDTGGQQSARFLYMR
jgi:hypothetical protein